MNTNTTRAASEAARVYAARQGRIACAAPYAPGFPYACTLPPGHAGDHEDHASDAPNVLAWQDRYAGAHRTPHVATTTPDASGVWRCADCGAAIPAPFGTEA